MQSFNWHVETGITLVKTVPRCCGSRQARHQPRGLCIGLAATFVEQNEVSWHNAWNSRLKYGAISYLWNAIHAVLWRTLDVFWTVFFVRISQNIIWKTREEIFSIVFFFFLLLSSFVSIFLVRLEYGHFHSAQRDTKCSHFNTLSPVYKRWCHVCSRFDCVLIVVHLHLPST